MTTTFQPECRGNYGVHQPRAIHVHTQFMLSGNFTYRLNLIQRKNSTAGPVGSILDCYQAGWGHVHIYGPDYRSNLLGCKDAPFTGYRLQLYLAMESGPARFIVHDVGTQLTDNFISRLGVGLDRQLIAHGTRRHQQCCLFAE